MVRTEIPTALSALQKNDTVWHLDQAHTVSVVENGDGYTVVTLVAPNGARRNLFGAPTTTVARQAR